MTTEEEEEKEKGDEVLGDLSMVKKTPSKFGRLRSPSFEGYFASKSGPVALQAGNAFISNPEKIGEIQEHLDYMASLLREIDILRMAVRVESHNASRKRYLTVVSSEVEHSAIIGIDWTTGEGPTVGLVLPIWSTTVVKLDGDGGFHVSRTSTLNHIFKPVSVQTLWSARQVIDKTIDYACKHKYFEGVNTNGFLEHYTSIINSKQKSIAEWNVLDDLSSHVMGKVNLPADLDPEEERIKNLIKMKLREVMRNVDLDAVTMRDVRIMCEKEVNMSLVNYKKFVDEQILVVMGQMDSASCIIDYLYLGSEWNATDLVALKELGIGYILNITREVDNFFPQNMFYYNIRVYDEETTELLKHWDHTYRFIEKAREAGSKVLVHCRHGISRSSSTVIAYLMKKRGWSMGYTLDYVQDIRPVVQPNPGFTKQLIIYEGILNSSRNRFNSLFRQRAGSRDGTDESLSSIVDNRKTLPVSPLTATDDIEDHSSSEKAKNKDDTVDGESDTNKMGTDEEKETTRSNDVKERREHFSSPSFEQSPAPQKKLRRAKTMLSGAVFIDHEDESEVGSIRSSGSGTSNGKDGSHLSDAAEDAVMEQVVMASHMKTELMASVKKLHDGSLDHDDSTSEFDGNRPLEESNIKPSHLRRLSTDAQLLHLENIANMKKRKSLTEQEIAKESSMEIVDEVLSVSEARVEQNKVGELSEVFTRRSKKHVKDCTRRRTLGDYKFLSGGSFDEPNPNEENKITSVQGDEQQNPGKLELPFKSEKIYEGTPQFSRSRQGGKLRRSVTWTSSRWDSYTRDLEMRFIKEKYETKAYFNSINELNLEIQELIRTFDNVGDSSKISVEETSEDIRVADLVHLHDQIIRKKFSRQTASSLLPDSELEHGRLVMEFDGSKESEDSQKNIKRVQSFPRRNKKVSLTRDTNKNTDLRLREIESRSVPVSPNIFKNPDENNFTNAEKVVEDDEDSQQEPIPDVKLIVSKYETRQRSVDLDGDDDRKRSSSVGEKGKIIAEQGDTARRRASSTTCDLRSFDENKSKAQRKE